MRLSRRRFLVVTGAAATTACSSDPVTPALDAAVDASAVDASAVDVPAKDAPAEDVVDAAAPAEDAALDAGLEDAAVDVPAADDVTDTAAVEDVSDAAVPADGAVDATLRLPELATAFPLGAMAGDMDATSAVLWTRYAGGATLALRVERMVDGRPVETVLDRDVPAGPDGFTHFLAEGLTPGQRYRAVFLSRSGTAVMGRSLAVRFRTALAPDALEVVTLGATSCTHARHRPFAPLQRLAAEANLDAFVHLGDMAYCDDSRSIEDFRTKYRQNYESEGFRAMFAAAGLYTTWDDHEVDNNFNPETVSATVLANARRAYFEHRAQRRHPTEADRIWRSFRWGATLELFVLDGRGERRPSTRTSRTAQYLSRAQMDWLKEGLLRSTARFKVVVNSVPITNFPFTFGNGEDRWEGYAAARDEILNHITERRIQGVWWLSGDFHLGCVGKLENSGTRSALREVLAGPGGQIPNPLYLSLVPPQFDFTTGENNYVTLRADPARNELTVRFVNGDGRAIFTRTYANAAP
jgi:alkaline phosphatase D